MISILCGHVVVLQYELSEMVTFTMDVLEKTEFPDIVALQVCWEEARSLYHHRNIEAENLGCPCRYVCLFFLLIICFYVSRKAE